MLEVCAWGAYRSHILKETVQQQLLEREPLMAILSTVFEEVENCPNRKQCH